MKTTPVLAAVCSLAFAAPCLADTFTLKDGTTLEGTVLREDAENYTLVIQVTKSIKDERVVPKAEVVKIERERQDETAFEEIAKSVPTPDLLSADDYADRISAVNRFLKEHPESSKAAEAKKMLATLKEEQAAVEAGGIKMNGAMVPPQEYAANALEIDAKVQEAKIRSLVAANQLLGALRVFDEFSKEYSTTLSYGALVPVMTQVVQTYVNEAKQALATLEDRTKARQVGLDRMAADDRVVTQKAIEDETAAIEKRFKAEKDARVNWVTTSPYYRPALEEAVRYGQTELQRLGSQQTELGKDAGKAYRDAWSTIHSGADESAVSNALNDARNAGIPQRYIEKLEAEAKNRK